MAQFVMFLMEFARESLTTDRAGVYCLLAFHGDGIECLREIAHLRMK